MSLSQQNESFNTKIQSIIDKARSFYPELEDTTVEFQLVKAMKKAFMLAQPRVITLFGPKDKREYIIKISDTLRLENHTTPVSDMPEDVLVGWMGHELGHIMDYQTKSLAGVLRFGLGYWLSSKYIKPLPHLFLEKPG